MCGVDILERFFFGGQEVAGMRQRVSESPRVSVSECIHIFISI